MSENIKNQKIDSDLKDFIETATKLSPSDKEKFLYMMFGAILVNETVEKSTA